MTAALNGQHVPSPPPDPAPEVARAVWTAGMEADDAPFDDLTPDDQTQLTDYARAYITAHIAWMQVQGLRILPPGSAVVPKSDDEAAAMLLAVKSYRESKKRKGGLLLQDKKLILPPGGKLQ